jgi:hypothetical protein
MNGNSVVYLPPKFPLLPTPMSPHLFNRARHRRVLIQLLAFSSIAVSSAGATAFVWSGGSGTWASSGWTKPTGGSGTSPGDDQNRSDTASIASGTVTLATSLQRNNLQLSLSGGILNLQADFRPGATVQVSGGVLNVVTHQTEATMNVTGGTVTGTGTVGGSRAVTFSTSAIHAPGGVGAVGTQTIGSNSIYNAGSTLSWDIGGTTSFDRVTQTSAQVSAGTFLVNVMGSVDFSDSFWDTNRAFQVADFQNGGWFNSFSVVGATTGGNFVLANPANNQITRNFIYWNTNAAPSVVPEPTSAMLLILSAAGLFFRRRTA